MCGTLAHRFRRIAALAVAAAISAGVSAMGGSVDGEVSMVKSMKMGTRQIWGNYGFNGSLRRVGIYG